jgi:hypothetical protein
MIRTIALLWLAILLAVYLVLIVSSPLHKKTHQRRPQDELQYR